MKKKIWGFLVVFALFAASVFLVFFMPSGRLFNQTASDVTIESDIRVPYVEGDQLESIEKVEPDESSLPQDEEPKLDLVEVDQYDAEQQYQMGGRYFRGDGVEQDYQKAMQWYSKAAEQNHLKAQSNIGALYYHGLGVKQDYQKAFEWSLKAANGGFVGAQFAVGRMYDLGRGVRQDYKKAFEWYLKVGSQTHYELALGTDYAEAQFNLGTMYAKGQGVKQNDKEAVKWYLKSAEQGYANAQYNLGSMYFYGRGVKKDHKQALTLLIKAADQGLPEAIELLNRVKEAYEKEYSSQQDEGK